MPDAEYWRILRVEDGELIEKYTRVHYELGKVTDFVFQLSVKSRLPDNAERRVIRRYDCKHGFPHCDVYNAAGEQIRKELIAADSIHEASLISESELNAHWRRFVEEYRGSIGRRR